MGCDYRSIVVVTSGVDGVDSIVGCEDEVLAVEGKVKDFGHHRTVRAKRRRRGSVCAAIKFILAMWCVFQGSVDEKSDTR